MTTVFVTGATGVLGRATIPQLIAAGYRVRALSRSAENDDAIHAMGAEPVRGNLFDVDALERSMSGSNAVMHLATHIPPSSQTRNRQAWRTNDRLRAEGTRNLVDAALSTGANVFVYPSFAFVYPDSGEAWIDAASTATDPVEIVKSTIAAEAEVARFASTDGDSARRGVALRLGGLYGPDLPSTKEQLGLARRGIAPLPAGDGYIPVLWIDDAASALVAAVERAPSGLYDVVDDEPLRQREFVEALARAVGRRRLLAPPRWAVGLLAGDAGRALSRSQRISNRRFREATGWEPAVPSAREGFARLAVRLERPPYVPTLVRVGLWVMALFALIAGLWQQFAPRSFYDDFPGFGRHWVSVDGPYNEHLLRDLGGANLTLAVLIFFALAKPSVGLVRAAAAATLVSQVSHFIYHAFHLGTLATPLDQILQTAALTVTVLIPVLVLLRAGEIGRNARMQPGLPGQPRDPEISVRKLIASTS
jgi:nucleoside-diphosphate-sugar epimerase